MLLDQGPLWVHHRPPFATAYPVERGRLSPMVREECCVYISRDMRQCVVGERT